MKFFDFGAFQEIEKLLSHDKILFHMLFGAFHDTSCNSFSDCQGIFDPIQKVEPEIASEWYFRVQPIGQSRRFCNFCNIYLYRNRKRKDLKKLRNCVIRGMIGLTYNKWFCFMFNRKLFWSWIQNFVLFHVQKLGFCC